MERTKALVSVDEQTFVSRTLFNWLNRFPDKPVGKINFEYLQDRDGMAISTIQSAYKVRQYITGDYQAQYPFKVVYRTRPSTNDERLQAEEMLNQIGEWAAANYDSLDLGANKRVVSISRDTAAALFARYEGGMEDYQILMNLTYEVIK